MFLLLLMIIMFPLISLLWILNVILHFQLFWDVPFFCTVGAIIDMKEGNIKFQFPLKKGMEHFPRKKVKLPFESVVRASYSFTLDKT